MTVLDVIRPAWQHQGACHDMATEIFFPDRGISTNPAKAICAGCTVRAECLEHSMTQPERFGIWGGLSERERRRIRKVRLHAARATRIDAARCGTRSGYNAHQRRHERACDACLAAAATYARDHHHKAAS